MKLDSEPAQILPVTTREELNYAPLEEVEKAIRALTDTEHAKLMLIAKGFCKSRRLAAGVMEPEELVSEAFVKTLQMEKKWNKRVSMIKHLDRAMENISGHVVKKRLRIISFADEPPSDLIPANSERLENAADNHLIEKEEVEALLTAVFGTDTEAAKIFVLRAEGFEAADIQANLYLIGPQYETIAKRIRRKIAIFLTQKH